MTKDEALKMAVEELKNYKESQEICAYNLGFDERWSVDRIDKAINACKEALEQPAQEPVLKVVYGEICYLSKEDDQSYGMWCPVTENYKPPFKNETNFYTHPHQWQGLTDDEIYKCQHPEYPDTMYFARAIEQALKEKNT